MTASDNLMTTRQLVFNACDQLLNEDIEPSVRTVLAKVPSIKSTSTIHKYWSEWLTSVRAKASENTKQRAISDQLKTALLREIDIHIKECEVRTASSISDANSLRDSAFADLEDIEKILAAEQFRADKNHEDLIEARQTIESQTKSHEAVVGELRRQLEEIQASNKILTEKELQSTALASKLTAQVEAHKENLEKERALNAEAVTKQSSMQTALDERISDAVRLEAELKASLSHNSILQTQQNKVESAFNDLQEKNSDLRERLARTEARLSSEQENAAVHLLAVTELKQKLAEADLLLNKQATAIASLSKHD